MKTIALYCNPTPHNSKAVPVLKKIVHCLNEKKIEYEIFQSEWKAPELYDQAWLVGGDGTINYFINQFPDINIPICTFGGGSGNDFH